MTNTFHYTQILQTSSRWHVHIVDLVFNPTDAPSQDDARWTGICEDVGIWIKPDGGNDGIDIGIGVGIDCPTMLALSIVPMIMKSEALCIM